MNRFQEFVENGKEGKMNILLMHSEWRTLTSGVVLHLIIKSKHVLQSSSCFVKCLSTDIAQTLTHFPRIIENKFSVIGALV